MIFIFVLFFLFLGFVGGLFTACSFTIDMLRDGAKTKIPLIGKFNITVVGEPEQE